MRNNSVILSLKMAGDETCYVVVPQCDVQNGLALHPLVVGEVGKWELHERYYSISHVEQGLRLGFRDYAEILDVAPRYFLRRLLAEASKIAQWPYWHAFTTTEKLATNKAWREVCDKYAQLALDEAFTRTTNKRVNQHTIERLRCRIAIDAKASRETN